MMNPADAKHEGRNPKITSALNGSSVSSNPPCYRPSMSVPAKPPGSPAKRLRILCLHNASEEVNARLQQLVKLQQQEEEKRGGPKQMHQQQQQKISRIQQHDVGVHQCEKQCHTYASAAAATGCAACATLNGHGDLGSEARSSKDEIPASMADGDGDPLLEFVKLDLRDLPALMRLFQEKKFAAVIHYAGLKSSVESIRKPLDYYINNVGGTLHLLQAMRATGCRILVFSSSATVYKALPDRPLREDDARDASHPYSRSKLFVEQILEDLHAGEERDYWRIAILRYFNPIGAHASGLIGEQPSGVPKNLVPYIQQVAIKKLPYVNIFGSDYCTRDGTGVRDYLHIEDLARGHVAALRKLEKGADEEEMGTMNGNGYVEEKQKGIITAASCCCKRSSQEEGCLHVYNLGTGRGVSALELLKMFEEASGQSIPYKVVGRRPGDLASVIADPTKAEKQLLWKAERSLHDALASAWNWQLMNPNGYTSEATNCWSNASTNGCESSMLIDVSEGKKHPQQQ